jgi:orotate phosphoribosyltransferase
MNLKDSFMNFEEILRKYKVLKSGHFLLSSGLHSNKYFEKFRILENPTLVKKFAQKIADYFKPYKIQIVCGPTTGGIIIAYEVARQLKCQCIFAEKATGESGRVIRRGFIIPKNSKILVVDDVLTTGGSINDTLQALKKFSGKIVGIAVFIDRSETPLNFLVNAEEIKLFSCYKVRVENYRPENCPLCKDRIPLEVPGKGQG